MNFTDLTGILEILNSESATNINEALKETSALNDFLYTLSPTERAIILKKIQLFAESDSRNVTYDSKTEQFYPPYMKMDIVHCDFTGVGFEWDGPHYALVWEVDPKFDSIMVIPTTSQPRKEFPSVFSVGTISGMTKNTTLLVSDMTRVSRRRLSPVEFDHPKKGKRKVRLATAWIPRIQESIVVTYANEPTFEEVLMQKCNVAMVKDLKVLRDWRFKPVKAVYNASTLTLEVRLWNGDEVETFELINPTNQINKNIKIELIKDLFSSDQKVKMAAEANYAKYYAQYVDTEV